MSSGCRRPAQLGPPLPVRPVTGQSSPIRSRSADDGRDEYEVRMIHEGGPTTLFYQHNPLDVEGWRGDNFAVHVQHRRLQRGDLRQRPPAADRAPVHASHRRLRDELPAQARRERAGHRAHAVVSPQRRLRRDRVLPWRRAVRHPDAARADFACAARCSPRRTREGKRAGPAQVRRTFPRRLAGDRDRHPPSAHPVGRGAGQRSRSGSARHRNGQHFHENSREDTTTTGSRIWLFTRTIQVSATYTAASPTWSCWKATC